jgi:hypothetical protein
MPTAAELPDFLSDLCGILGVLCGKDLDFAATHAKTLNRKGHEGFRKVRKGNQETRGAFLLIRFQYKYPGTPNSTIATPASACVGRVTIVLSVHALPINT